MSAPKEPSPHLAGAPVAGPASGRPEPQRRPSQFVRFVAVDLEGTGTEITPADFGACPLFGGREPSYALLRQFVANELGEGPVPGEGPTSADGVAAPHIAYMQRHELVDYCDVSEKGHLKWYPKGVLLRRLLLDYAGDLARDWGAFEMRNPILIRDGHNAIGQLMGEFHERDYRVDGGRGLGYLRYASDPLAFPFLQQVRFSYRQSPLKVYEETTCFRNEQEGEVSGLRRVRAFAMTDMHAACACQAEARAEFDGLCARFARLMDDVVAPGRWVLGWEGTVDFYEAHRPWLLDIGRRLGVPAFFKLMPEMSHYFAMKNEYQFIAGDGFNVQVSTVQWDVKDGARFDIGYVGQDGRRRPCPVILHASSFGSIERALCALLEGIALQARRGAPPAFPLWLSPTQVRLVPVSDAHAVPALELCEALARRQVRADVDDRSDTVGRRIRAGEQEWVPYLVVVGDREREGGRLQVRCRRERGQRDLDREGLIALVREQTGHLPYRPLPLPARVSRRPIFRG